MAAFDYQEFVDLAEELIAEFGRSCFLRKLPANPPDDTDKPWIVSTETPTDYPAMICFVPADVRSEPQQTAMDPNTVVHTDLHLCLVAASSFPDGVIPNLRDQVIDSDGSIWAIKSVNPLQPGDLTIYYALSLE